MASWWCRDVDTITRSGPTACWEPAFSRGPLRWPVDALLSRPFLPAFRQVINDFIQQIASPSILVLRCRWGPQARYSLRTGRRLSPHNPVVHHQQHRFWSGAGCLQCLYLVVSLLASVKKRSGRLFRWRSAPGTGKLGQQNVFGFRSMPRYQKGNHPVPQGVSIDPVPGDARMLPQWRCAGREDVEKGGFAHIGAAMMGQGFMVLLIGRMLTMYDEASPSLGNTEQAFPGSSAGPAASCRPETKARRCLTWFRIEDCV